MGWEYTITIDKKFIITLFLVATVLGGGLALIYWDLKTSLDTLKSSYAEMEDNYGAVSAQLETLQGLVEQLHYVQKLNLTAVQIYNNSRNSVVLVVAGTKSGSGSFTGLKPTARDTLSQTIMLWKTPKIISM